MSYFIVKKEIERAKQSLNNCVDFSYRIYKKNGQEIGMIFLKSIIDQNLLSSAIYYPLQTYDQPFDMDVIETNIIKCADVKQIKKKEMIKEVLEGKVILIGNFSNIILSIDLFKFPSRIPSEPPTSPVIQGPREGFVEDLQTNITLLRRRIRSEERL